MHHGAVRIRQVVARVRHPLRRGTAPLRRVALGLRAPVPGADGQAGRRLDRGALARDLDRSEDDVEEPALHRRHGHRGARLPAPAVRAHRAAPLPDLRPADRRPVRRADRRSGAGAPRGHALHGRCAARARPQGRAPRHPREPARRGLHARARRRRDVPSGRRAGARQEVQARHLGGRRPPRDQGRPAPAPERLDRDGPAHRRRPRRGARGRRARAHLLGEVRLPRARRVARRARPADVLVQLAARRLPGLHRPRRHARGRPRAGRARPRALHPRGCLGALERGRVELLRAGARGDRRPLGGAARRPVGQALERASGSVPERHRCRARVRDVQEPLRAQALVHDRLRGRRREPPAPLSRDAVAAPEGAHRDVHVDAAVLDLRRRAPAAGGARRDGRRAQHRLHLAPGGARGAGLLPRARAHRHRAPDRRARDPRDPRAADVPRRRRGRLPVAQPRRAHALGRRGPAHPPRHADRRQPRGRPLHPRRALDRPPPARQRAADRDARAPARHRQHRDRGRARRGDDARGRLGRRHGPGRRHPRRPCRRRGHGRGRREDARVADRAVPQRPALDSGAGEARRRHGLAQGTAA